MCAFRLRLFTLFLVTVAGQLPTAQAQFSDEISSPHWSMIVDDYGYSDLALDQRPGFEGREYLSGEWAAAISYVLEETQLSPVWLNPEFIFPDWDSNSDFGIETMGQVIGTNKHGFVIYRSVIANSLVRIQITSDMIDTTNGIPQGLASASGTMSSNIMSDRYVFRQSYEIQNISGQVLDGVRFFKFLHSLQATHAIYDNRNYGSTHNGHHYTISQQSPQEDAFPGEMVHHDTVAMHANLAPTGWEVGYYGIEGVDSHAIGRPTIGVHFSVESDALSGLDSFNPETPWVSGAMRFELGNLPANGTTNIEFLMSLQTETIAQPPFRVGALLTVTGWGDNSSGQTNIPNNLTGVVEIAAGDKHSVAVLNDGTVLAWGDGSLGQTNVPDLNISYIWDLAAGGNHSLIANYFGGVIAWGDNAFGQTNVPPDLTDVEAVAAGARHSLALLWDGTVVAWGDNSLGQTDVPEELEAWEIAAGGSHNLALDGSSRVVAWGDNSQGQTNVPGDLDYVDQVAAGRNHSVALLYDGTVVAWGDNSSGQTNVPAGLNNVMDIAAGNDFTLALKRDGTLVGWGNGAFGQTNIPSGLSHVESIAAGGRHSLARYVFPGTVSLSMIQQGTNCVISWPANLSSYTYLDAVIEEVDSLTSTNWQEMSTESRVEDGLYRLPVSNGTSGRFFRLRIVESDF